MDYLAKRISFPLEREYEAWIVHQIDRYFRRLSVSVITFAVSPDDESTWPADEVVDVQGKIVGLQFKRPTLSPRTTHSSPNEFSRLLWDFSKPHRQLQRVVANAEIFYCLPTFMNRDVRPYALHHCLFWRPDDESDHRAWYENTNSSVSTKYTKICDAPRWGLFAERFIRCTIGRSLGGQPFSTYMRSLRPDLSAPADGAGTTIQVLVLRREAGNLTTA